ncbi:MAG: acyltransferase [Isosphaeraceae bacterium]
MERIPELDALRGIAAVMILALHLGLGKTYPFLASAVDLFFVLSGYLITRIILEHRSRPAFLAAFFARRCLRIWPIYYALLLGFVAINRWLPHPSRLDALPQFLTYTQFFQHYWFARPKWFSIYFNHTWTLAAEEQFYLFWPLIAVVLGRRGLLLSIPILIVSAFVARLWLWPMLLLTNWDGFAMGAALAWFLGKPGHSETRRPIGTAIWALIALGCLSYAAWRAPVVSALIGSFPKYGGKLAESWNSTRIFLASAAIVALAIRHAGHPWLQVLRHPVLCYLGTISYGLYLFHFPIYAILSPNHYFPICNDPMWLDALKLAASVGFAALSWRYFERPILALKRFVPYPGERSPIPRPHVGIAPAVDQAATSR